MQSEFSADLIRFSIQAPIYQLFFVLFPQWLLVGKWSSRWPAAFPDFPLSYFTLKTCFGPSSNDNRKEPRGMKVFTFYSGSSPEEGWCFSFKNKKSAGSCSCRPQAIRNVPTRNACWPQMGKIPQTGTNTAVYSSLKVGFLVLAKCQTFAVPRDCNNSLNWILQNDTCATNLPLGHICQRPQ